MMEPLPLPPLPKMDPAHSIPYESIRYIPGYAESTIHRIIAARDAQWQEAMRTAHAQGYREGLEAAEKAAKDLPRLATDDYTEGYAEGCDQCAAAIRALPRAGMDGLGIHAGSHDRAPLWKPGQ